MENLKSIFLVTVLTAICFLLCAKISNGQPDTIITSTLSKNSEIFCPTSKIIDSIEIIISNPITNNILINYTGLSITYYFESKGIYIINLKDSTINITINIWFDTTAQTGINDYNNIPVEKTLTAIYNLNGQLITKEQSYNQICIIRYKDGYIEKRYVVRR